MYLQSLINARAKPAAGPRAPGAVTRFVRLAAAVPGGRPLLVGAATRWGGPPRRPFPARFTIPDIAAGSPHVAKLQSLVSEKAMESQSQLLLAVNGRAWRYILVEFGKDLPKFDINLQFIERYVAIYFAMGKTAQDLLRNVDEQLPELEGTAEEHAAARQSVMLSIIVQAVTAAVPTAAFLLFGDWIKAGLDFLQKTIN
jgi:hypothetical protein